jgi:site-specific DNA recombinase
VDPEVFEQVQEILNRNARTGGRDMRNKYGALLRGLLRCAHCECAMSHHYSTKKKTLYRYYVCRQAQQMGWKTCPTPSIPAPEIEQFVVDQIKGIGRDPELLRETLAQARREAEDTIRRLESEREALKRQCRRDEAEFLELGTATDARAVDRLADLQDRLAGAERRLTEIHEELLALRGHLVDESEVEMALRGFDLVWEQLSPREQSRILELLIERVDFDGKDGQVSIVFRSSGFHGLIARMQEEAA